MDLQACIWHLLWFFTADSFSCGRSFLYVHLIYFVIFSKQCVNLCISLCIILNGNIVSFTNINSHSCLSETLLMVVTFKCIHNLLLFIPSQSCLSSSHCLPFAPFTSAAGLLGFQLSSWPANMPAALTDSSQIICEVWASNVEEEMRKIRQIIQSFNYIAMVRDEQFEMS